MHVADAKLFLRSAGRYLLEGTSSMSARSRSAHPHPWPHAGQPLLPGRQPPLHGDTLLAGGIARAPRLRPPTADDQHRHKLLRLPLTTAVYPGHGPAPAWRLSSGRTRSCGGPEKVPPRLVALGRAKGVGRAQALPSTATGGKPSPSIQDGLRKTPPPARGAWRDENRLDREGHLQPVQGAEWLLGNHLLGSDDGASFGVDEDQVGVASGWTTPLRGRGRRSSPALPSPS